MPKRVSPERWVPALSFFPGATPLPEIGAYNLRSRVLEDWDLRPHLSPGEGGNGRGIGPPGNECLHC